MEATDLIAAHRHSSNHRQEIEASKVCGCFYCLAVFPPASIDEWCDEDGTALCPKCGIDSVIGDELSAHMRDAAGAVASIDVGDAVVASVRVDDQRALCSAEQPPLRPSLSATDRSSSSVCLWESAAVASPNVVAKARLELAFVDAELP